MMKLEKEQRAQFIVLCALLVVVFGFGAFRMLGTGTSASSPTTAPAASAEKAAPAKAAAPTAEKTPVEQQPPAQDLAKAMGFVMPVKDPFAPQTVPESESEKPATTNIPPPTRRLPLIVQEPNMPIPVMPTFGPEPGSTSPAAVVEQLDPSKDYKLTGVIEGDRNIAIIRGPEESRHIIREGQSLDGKYVIRSISRAGVRLSANGRSYFLTLSSGKGA